MTKAIDYSNSDLSIGAKYGKREIIGDRKRIKDTWHILCKCECGTIKYVKQYDLVKCLYPTCINCRKYDNYGKHKLSRSRIYRIYYGDIVLEVEYNPRENGRYNNYQNGCWQVRVYEPIAIENVREL